MEVIHGDTDVCVPIVDVDTHTMGASLKRYVNQRLHQDITQRTWKTIRIGFPSFRDPPAILSTWEVNRPKAPFNFRRPTTRVRDDDSIELHCFPSPSFVHHYASVLFTYLRLHKAKNHPGSQQTRITINLPSMASLYQTLKQSNLLRCPASDILIIGEVHRLTRLLGGRRWEIAAPLSEIGHTPVTAAHDEDLFAWSRHQMTNGRSLTLLGCKEGLWGEAAGAVLRMLAEAAKAKSFIYVGKVGALSTGHAPNQTIVTGDKAFFAEGPEGPASTSKVPLIWTNPLARAIETTRAGIQVVSGDIVSVSTPLWETSDWLAKWRGKTDWVDCETAHMARAAIATGVQFGYLHIVSDNLVAQNHENLSNEELEEVHEMRNQLYDMIERIIITYLESAETTL